MNICKSKKKSCIKLAPENNSTKEIKPKNSLWDIWDKKIVNQVTVDKLPGINCEKLFCINLLSLFCKVFVGYYFHNRLTKFAAKKFGD